MSKQITIDIDASAAARKLVVTIPDITLSLQGNTIVPSQASPTWSLPAATPIPTPTPVPIPDPSTDIQEIIFPMQDLTKGDYARPGAGANNFYGGNGSQTPLPFKMLDDDTRFPWAKLQPGQTNYDFSALAAAINRMISAGGKLSFRVTTFDPSSKYYPSFVPTFSGNMPDFNSEVYLSAYEKFVAAMATYLKTTDSVIKGIKLIQGVYKVDIGGIGKWSEMHFDGISSGIITAASGIRILKAYTSNFTDTWLMITISGLTNNSGLPSELAKALLNASNNLGPVGIRCDHLGWVGTFGFDMDASKYWSSDMFPAVKSRYLKAPVCGELMNTLSGIGTTPYGDLANELKQIGGSQFSNNNYCRVANTGASAAQITASDANIAAASKSAGARVSMNKATIFGNKLSIDWNVANAPVYEPWQVWIVTDQGSFQSSMKTIMGFVGGETSTDTLPAGTKTISIILKDPDGYRAPYPLLNTGRQTDGSYKIV